jgi:acetyl-CoA synthetase
MSGKTITSLLREERVYHPPEEIVNRAWVGEEVYERAEGDFEGFWEEIAEEIDWFERWDKVLEWEAPFAKWFVNGKLNVSYNCIDRHIKGWRRNKAAIIWEGEPGDRRTLTYYDLYREVCRFAGGLKKLGVEKGDRVAIYLPMIPELPISMLACARIGAIHSVVFGGFSAKALRERINDSQAKVLITADGGYRRGKIIPLKEMADEALKGAESVEKVVVVKRTGGVELNDREVWWHEVSGESSKPEVMDSEEPLFILYTSGTTGKPKGVVHVNGGYLVGVYITTKWIFDLRDEDVFWCTADIGWITGHSYIVYGPLANGATVVMYEGAPDFPKPDRFWEIVERYGVSVFYTAPTAIRAFMKWGEEWVKKHDLSSLRLLGTVGEPINPKAWEWYHRVIGQGKCPIMDTWWQTETGMILISPLPFTPLKPGSAAKPFPGVKAEVVDEDGDPCRVGEGGLLVVTRPWPAMLRGLYNNPERYVKTYWERFEGIYLTGDAAKKDEDGYFWILGRSDDVLNVSGHRIGTMEVESALVSHPAVAEAAVVGRPHEVKGQSIVAYVVLKEGVDGRVEELKKHVRQEIGSIAVPDEIHVVKALPKTRSGKIMRRIMRAVERGEEIGDTSTLEDERAVEEIKFTSL